MKKIMVVFLIFVAIAFCGCGSEKDKAPNIVQEKNDVIMKDATDSEEGKNNNSDNDFEIDCSTVKMVCDADNEVAAIVYFDFRNNTKNEISISDVYKIEIEQNGKKCEEDNRIKDAPDELYAQEKTIGPGESVECAYAFRLYDQTTPISLSIKGEYGSYSYTKSDLIELDVTNEPEESDVKKIVVPDVVGKTVSEASDILNEAGVAAKATYTPSEEYEKDIVISQDIPAGSEMGINKSINLVISSGPQ